MSEINLATIKNPVLLLKIPDGVDTNNNPIFYEKKYELYDLIEKAQEIQDQRIEINTKLSSQNKPIPNFLKSHVEDVNKLFGFPIKDGKKTFVLTNNQAIALWEAFQADLKAEEDKAKKS